jgi:hypothetical protein
MKLTASQKCWDEPIMVFVQSKEIFAIAIMLQLSLLSSQAIFATCNGK